MIVSLSSSFLSELAEKFSDAVKVPVFSEESQSWSIEIRRDGYDPELCKSCGIIELPNGKKIWDLPCSSSFDCRELSPCCRYCRDWIPYKFIIAEMIKYCNRYNCNYELPSNHPYYKLLKDHLPKEESASKTWYSLVPQERLPFNQESIDKLIKFCEICFNNDDRFKSSSWCVESGKHKSKPNLHIHCLAEFKDSKNFRRILLSTWKSIFPEHKYRLDWKDGKRRGIDYKICNTPEMRADKITYMNNDQKGSHENFMDLNVKGGLSS